MMCVAFAFKKKIHAQGVHPVGMNLKASRVLLRFLFFGLACSDEGADESSINSVSLFRRERVVIEALAPPPSLWLALLLALHPRLRSVCARRGVGPQARVQEPRAEMREPRARKPVRSDAGCHTAILR